eukprot:CAMPEP_0182908304 /NCGR_PEP_ID=MMETSP0034_2-20130328/35137_1 /TAXON_ID=156128 /ORGANISM="Nephroselmis pyriformis, Strain CCMP717" /LENGTH=90 /DNA_ID=CAMNT_0025044475 /DNA_START=106 /DNA_END=374 /DNA_ORIENTATION=-
MRTPHAMTCKVHSPALLGHHSAASHARGGREDGMMEMAPDCFGAQAASDKQCGTSSGWGGMGAPLCMADHDLLSFSAQSACSSYMEKTAS